MTTLAQLAATTASRRTGRSYAALLLLVGVLALWLALRSGDVPYDVDSASYIDQARSLLEGKGFQTRPYDLYDMSADAGPDTLFPPGYPMVIAAVSVATGTSVQAVAPWLSRVALLLLPLTIFFAFRTVIGDRGAACVGALCALTPGVIGLAPYAMSDVFALTLVVAAFGLSTAAWSARDMRKALGFAFCGGLLAGFVYLVRNANLALLAAIPLSIGVWLLLAQRSEKALTWKIGVAWGLGVAIVVLPWLVRNLQVFGKLQPYWMPPSSVGGWFNFRSYLVAQSSELAGSPSLAAHLATSNVALAAIVLLFGILAYLSWRYWPDFSSIEKRTFVGAVAFATAGGAIVIAARTRYEWGALITDRYAVPYTPFLLLAAAILLRHLPVRKNLLIAMTTVMVLSLFLMRIVSLSHSDERWDGALQASKRVVAHRIETTTPDTPGPCSGPPKPMVVSNFAYLYRVLCDADARHLGAGGMGWMSIADGLTFVKAKVAQRRVVVALHPGHGLEPGDLPLNVDAREALLHQGWTLIENSSEALVVSGQWAR